MQNLDCTVDQSKEQTCTQQYAGQGDPYVLPYGDYGVEYVLSAPLPVVKGLPWAATRVA